MPSPFTDPVLGGRQFGQDLYNLNLFDPNVLAQLQQMFQPLFQQQYGNLGSFRSNAMNQAGQSAGSAALAYGYANPASYAETARLKTASSFEPALMGLGESQLQNLLNSVMQSQRFRGGNLSDLLSHSEGARQFNTGLDSQPTFLEDLLSGLIQGGSQVGAAYLGRPQYNFGR